MIKVCINCNKEFETSNNRKVFCSNSCKVINHRRRNGIEEPEFLTKNKKVPTETVEKVRDVVKKVDNPTYLSLSSQVFAYNEEYDKLLKKKESIFKELQEKQNTAHPVLAASIMGIGGISVLIDNSKQKRPKFENALLGLGALAFGAITASNSENIVRKKKIDIEKLSDKIKEIDSQINYALYNKNYFDSLLKETPKFNEITEQETYFEEVPITIEQEPKTTKTNIVSLSEIKEKEFEVYEFTEPYLNLIGKPSKNFLMLVWGESGHGKSTWSMDFANYLASNFGKLLYNSSEEGISYSLKNKLLKYDNENFDLSECKTYSELKKAIKNYDFIVVDSLNDMNLTEEDFEKLIKSGKSIIFIMQATKGGNFKGSSKFAHDTDIRIKIENYQPIVEKTRFK